MIIFLIGFMGCGKSTLGKRLARKIDYEFQDMDTEIEEKAGMTVNEIFAQKGESWFRKAESEFLHSLDASKNMVIATGGGAPCFGDNMEEMNRLGITVYLKMSPVSLASRLENTRSLRPLLKDLTPGVLPDYIGERLKEREVWYNKAKCIIKAESVKPAHVVALVFGAAE